MKIVITASFEVIKGTEAAKAKKGQYGGFTAFGDDNDWKIGKTFCGIFHCGSAKMVAKRLGKV